jgi:ABC-type bacteriocin/lantibiotic exporter with double-glycine peptidase domain
VVSALRGLIGYVPAGPLLLEGTLRENLMFGTTPGRAQDLRELLREIDFFRGTGLTPIDLDRKVSEIGARLSDGQRQLVALIRLLLRRPQIAIIDEGTAFLDGVNHHRVLELARRRLKNVTVLWATHDYEQLESFDAVMVLAGGRLESYGTAATVLRESPWLRDVLDNRRRMSCPA